MTARLSVLGELRAHGREVEIIVRPRWTDADLEVAASLSGEPVRITIEPADAEPQPAGAELAADLLAQMKRAIEEAGVTSSLILRISSLANSAHLALLNAQRGGT